MPEKQGRRVRVAQDHGKVECSFSLRIDVDGGSTLEQVGYKRFMICNNCLDEEGVAEWRHGRGIDSRGVPIEPRRHLGLLVGLRRRWRKIAIAPGWVRLPHRSHFFSEIFFLVCEKFVTPLPG